jgi:hypothetical protein
LPSLPATVTETCGMTAALGPHRDDATTGDADRLRTHVPTSSPSLRSLCSMTRGPAARCPCSADSPTLGRSERRWPPRHRGSPLAAPADPSSSDTGTRSIAGPIPWPAHAAAIPRSRSRR